jgi:PhzF family phenazine biosynthesis protein
VSPVELVNPRKKVYKERKMSPVEIRQVDAFTETCLTGNPAGVVANGDGLTDEQMQRIAREMFVSETAFFLPPTNHGADLRIRWFTPETEVPLCGHATIAGFHVLAEEEMHGMRKAGTYQFRLETRSGILPVTVVKGPERIDVRMGLNVPKFTRAGQYKLDVLRLLNISLDQIENRMPIVATDYLYVPIRRLHTIFAMKPNFSGMAQFLVNRKLSGICVFTLETIERTSAVHSRFFAPSVGINEDPVTGSSHGPLGAYLVEFGKLKPEGDTVVLIGEQGDVIGRRGRVAVEISLQGKEIRSLSIGGRAVTVLRGELFLP